MPESGAEVQEQAGPAPSLLGFKALRAPGPGRRGRAGRSGPQQHPGRGHSSTSGWPSKELPSQQPSTALAPEMQHQPQQSHVTDHMGQARPATADNQVHHKQVKVLQRNAAGADSVAAQAAPSGRSQAATLHGESSSARPQEPFATGRLHIGEHVELGLWCVRHFVSCVLSLGESCQCLMPAFAESALFIT